MFFVGISAHIFIYLLVPAFLIIWYYCRGIKGGSEVQAAFPTEVSYEYSSVGYSEDTCFYEVPASGKKAVKRTWPLWTATVPLRLYTIYLSYIPSVCITGNHILRAPPCCR